MSTPSTAGSAQASPIALQALHRFMTRHAWQLGWRLVLLMALGGACGWALLPPALPATAAVLGAACLLVLASLLRHVRQTNLELARLTGLLQHGELMQTFQARYSDTGYPELANALETLVAGLRQESTFRLAEAAHWRALLEQVPTPLLAVDDGNGAGEDDAHVELLNHAARRLFDRHAAHGPRLSAYAAYGSRVPAGLACREANFVLELTPPDDAPLRLRVTQSAVVHLGRAQRLLALQPVQADIAAAQLALAGDLVRVLSHEVMNSLTPVTSLAATAASAAATLPPSDLAHRVQTATAAVARRAGGLLSFVQGYRQLARPPAPHRRMLSATALLDDLRALFESEWPSGQPELVVLLAEPGLQLHADPDQLQQLLLNLLRNAAQASRAHTAVPRVELRLQAARSGRCLIEVHDNGPGIAPTLREEVFLPFFTTKPMGSGIGLSVARQVALAHGGSIQALDSPLGGACLRLVV